MYLKLVFRNVRRSLRDYLIYLVTMTICVTVFYAFLSISSRYYQPDVGAEYNLSFLRDGMRAAIFAVALLLLFLIWYVNRYMLKSRQKEFAVMTVMGMEQKTVGKLFLAETFVMGLVAVGLGIVLGMFGSQFITAMLLSSYGKSYEISWMFFPDTVALTAAFFAAGFLLVGGFHFRSIQKIKVIDMLYGERYNEKSIKKSRFMPGMALVYEGMLFIMLWQGLREMRYYFDSRMAVPVHILFWGNILVPVAAILVSLVWVFRRRKWKWENFLAVWLVLAILNACLAASVPGMKKRYLLPFDNGTINCYLLFLVADLVFIICSIIYLACSFLTAWKEKSLVHKYTGENLFFFGELMTKLNTTTKTMSFICLTLAFAIFLFVAVIALAGWASGYLESRSMYDVQISSAYNNVYEEKDLPKGDYELVTAFLQEYGIETAYDSTFSLYLPRREEFHQRSKYDFPVAAISLSDYNAIREMLGMEKIALKENEFTTQWRISADGEFKEEFIETHRELETDEGKVYLAETESYEESIGQMLYNSYTDVLYVFPDEVCRGLLPVARNRLIQTTEKLSYEEAVELERRFQKEYPEENQEGAAWFIRTNTHQVNDSKAETFIMRASMMYGAMVLLVICFTILSMQQLSDTRQCRYRFGVLWQLGVEEKSIDRLVRRQLGVWFGLPVITAVVVSGIAIVYFLQMISVEIAAYIGYDVLLRQTGAVAVVLVSLLLCYFFSTLVLFRKMVLR